MEQNFPLRKEKISFLSVLGAFVLNFRQEAQNLEYLTKFLTSQLHKFGNLEQNLSSPKVEKGEKCLLYGFGLSAKIDELDKGK